MQKHQAPENYYDLVVVGDSRSAVGVSPDHVSGILKGWKIINFAFNSGGINEQMLGYAEMKLKKDSEKRTLLLGVSPHSLLTRAARNSHWNFLNKNSRLNMLVMRRFEKIINFFLSISFNDFYNFLRMGSVNVISRKTVYHDNGWIEEYRSSRSYVNTLKHYKNIFKKNAVNLKYWNEALKKIKQLVGDGVHVFGFRPPTIPEMELIEERLTGYDPGYIKKSFVEAGGTWLDFDLKNYTSYDGSHLNSPSAILFSRDLALKKKYFDNN